jgi:polysaccharide pyruvyl transferase WcaK-like protein
MHIHHFFPRTRNIGDHFVQRGIHKMVLRLYPGATFESFDVNSRGQSRSDYGLTRRAIERANQNADFIIVGGSNLYEGNYRWHWGVHVEASALELLRVPLILLGVGSGSNFNAPLHQPSTRAMREIRLLNKCAKLSGARDVLTLAWLRQRGISNAELTGDPAMFIFNRAYVERRSGSILLALPPRRLWNSKRQFWRSWKVGRPIFRAMAALAKRLMQQGESVIVCCNDPADLPIARALFAGAIEVVCPASPEEYFHLLESSRAVMTGRLHTAVAAFSLALPFALLNIDERTNGFIKTLGLDQCSISASTEDFEENLFRMMERLLRDDLCSWQELIAQRDRLYDQALTLLRQAMV